MDGAVESFFKPRLGPRKAFSTMALADPPVAASFVVSTQLILDLRLLDAPERAPYR